tara:strand:+ start:4109 stop:4612 length:504 start_codon:yes stop_codon:yes gene_type:complete
MEGVEIYKSISGNTATRLDLMTTKEYNYNRISICNTHATDDVSVDLYLSYVTNERGEYKIAVENDYSDLEQFTEDYYILKNCLVPYGSTVILNEEDFYINNLKYRLYIKLSGASSSVDIMIFDLQKSMSIKRNGDRYKEDVAHKKLNRRLGGRTNPVTGGSMGSGSY